MGAAGVSYVAPQVSVEGPWRLGGNGSELARTGKHGEGWLVGLVMPESSREMVEQ